MGVLMLDLDHFKRINDTYGHASGDAVLKAAAERMKRSVRAYDTVGRFGGEEFLVLLPGAGNDDVVQVAERIRIAMSGLPISVDGNLIVFSCSIGAAIRKPGESTSNTELMHDADMALYRSKENGRDQVTGAWSLSEAA
jgi:diguanylate cyclase (GGDEF)-like protein